jgi:23S rRNA (cytidine1920-2'-O)/16S rRNA (cytidine1409-2'-O)-methyltransferase
MMRTARADVMLCERGFFDSRARAREAIEMGLVRVDGRVIAKASTPVDETAEIIASAPHPWVSRGGVKLAHALTHFAINPTGQFCLDVGASTGGFTDVLLASGARHVVAVDVGREQLHAKLRVDSRVTSLESQDARTLTPAQLGEPPTLIVMDASFISLALLLPNVTHLAAPRCDLVALIKPQFEAGPGAARKGVVRAERIHRDVCARIASEIAGHGWRVGETIASPINGGDGNREFLIHARKP